MTFVTLSFKDQFDSLRFAVMMVTLGKAINIGESDMYQLFDKIILYFICSILFFLDNQSEFVVFYFVTMVILTCMSSLIDHWRIHATVALVFLVFCLLQPSCFYFIPLIFYDLWNIKRKYLLLLLYGIPLLRIYPDIRIDLLFGTLLLTGVSFLFHIRTNELNKLKHKCNSLRDDSTENSLAYRQQCQDLLERQDYEINVATLNERNRIARDIHDNVGHLLSSSILQVGALIAISKDDTTKTSLLTLKETLSKAMDSIRHSVHNLYEDSMDLYETLSNVIHEFTYCTTNFQYQLEQELSMKAKYAIVFIVKEALSNTIKHSNATTVDISLMEHPAFIQLHYRDNGTIKKYSEPQAYGLGVQSIVNRIDALQGQLRIDTQNGYHMFITLPKENR